MPTYLLNWNPNRFKWEKLAADSAATYRGEIVHDSWSTGGAKAIQPGDRIFLGRQGVEPKGVIASGVAASPYFEAEHWEDPRKMTTYNKVDFDTILDPQSLLPRSKLVQGVLQTVKWSSQRGGILINDDAAVQLEKKWDDHLRAIRFPVADEEQQATAIFGNEGRIKVRVHRERERNPALVHAKKADALRRFDKLECEVCKFVFKDRYGNHGTGFIECHHREPLSAIKQNRGRRVTMADLALVCANCHRMLHWQDWPSVEELRTRLVKR